MSGNHIPSKYPVGAAVVGGDYQGLGIVRSLGRLGVPIWVIDDELSISRYSRYATFTDRIPDLRNPERAVKDVIALAKRTGRKGWVLFPTRDENVAAFSRFRDELSEYFRVPTPAWDTVRFLWDKRNTYRLAAELGIPHPRTWVPGTERDLEAIYPHLPVALKPAIKEHFIHATGDKAWRANTPEQLRKLYAKGSRIVPKGELMVQDLVPGNGSSQFAYCAFFKNGKAVGSLMARRQRQHPPEFGRSSTYVETVEVPEIESYSERFLKAINYYGLVEVEYKRDDRDGQFRILDVNGRTWGYHTIGRPAGVDFPALLFNDQLGQAVEPARGKLDVRWIRVLTDFPTSIAEIFRGNLPLRLFLRTVREADEEAVYSWDDLVPGFAEIALIPYLMARRGYLIR
jgi:predicted ATP-grasp superfamily ATP-dependent carboligase